MKIKLDNPPKNLDKELIKHNTIDVLYTLYDAAERYSTHPTLEHSLTVLEEEVKELRKEIYKKPSKRKSSRIFTETMQVSAMALRLWHDYIIRDLEEDGGHNHV